MKIDTTIVDAYKKQESFPKAYEWVYTFTKGHRPIELHRQDVVTALVEELSFYQETGFPKWNKTLIAEIFDKELTALDACILLPIVGANASFDCGIVEKDTSLYVLIDVLNIADYTQILKQMQYILHNLLHVQFLKYMIQLRYSPCVNSYINQLAYLFFCDGLAQYLAWNEDITKKGFQDPMYEEKKKKSFALLYQAIQVEDPAIQESIVKKLANVSFWGQFAQAAGMFFADDLYHAQKEKGLHAYYLHGPDDIFNIVFS